MRGRMFLASLWLNSNIPDFGPYFRQLPLIIKKMTNPLPSPDSEADQSLPRTLREAVDRLTLQLSQAEKDKIAAASSADAIIVHFSLGAYIRKVFGLWRGNKALMASCGALNPEEASVVIIRELWARLRRQSGL
jgi:hypothetical protein